jgi:hypothetical protein
MIILTGSSNNFPTQRITLGDLAADLPTIVAVAHKNRD